MRRDRAALFVTALAGLAASLAPSAEGSEARLLRVARISGDAQHSAFTDLVRHSGRWLVAFREGEGHVSPAGVARVLVSEDGLNWRSTARITSPLGDVRDPKLSVTPEGRLLLVAGIALRAPGDVSHRSFAWLSEDGERWDAGTEIGEPGYWLWGVTWNAGVGWSVGYPTGSAGRGVRLYRTEDGRAWEVWVPALHTEGRPSEAAIAFAPDGTAWCLLRRDGDASNALLGRARPPYRHWSWHDLGHRIGGPALLRLSDGRWIAAGRRYDGAERTVLHWLDPGTAHLEDILTLPSGGDTSYPGLVEHRGDLWLSYYSSHEERTAVYFARVALPAPRQ